MDNTFGAIFYPINHSIIHENHFSCVQVSFSRFAELPRDFYQRKHCYASIDRAGSTFAEIKNIQFEIHFVKQCFLLCICTHLSARGSHRKTQIRFDTLCVCSFALRAFPLNDLSLVARWTTISRIATLLIYELFEIFFFYFLFFLFALIFDYSVSLRFPAIHLSVSHFRRFVWFINMNNHYVFPLRHYKMDEIQ